MNDEVPLDDLFHGCALRAFVEQARVQRAVPNSLVNLLALGV